MTSFVDCARKHQTKFRDTSPTISKRGRTPSDAQGMRYGHLLALGCEEDNLHPSLRDRDGSRSFFSERSIAWSAVAARNMNSSQVMCVNFMLPLADMDGALEAVVRAIDGDVERVIDIHHEGRRARVEFEWVGFDRPLERGQSPTRGKFVTNVDAFIIAETSAERRAYLMEWKYVEGEPENRTDYGTGAQGHTRRGRYSDLYHDPSSSFNHKVPMNTLLYGDFYQLMRNRLLADRMVANSELGVSDAKVVLVIPEGNSAYLQPPYLRDRFPEMGTTVPEVFRATLKDPDRAFATVSPSLLLNAVEKECGETVSAWAAYLRDRYGL